MFGLLRHGEELERINGMCLHGREWGNGCQHYAERAEKGRRR